MDHKTIVKNFLEKHNMYYDQIDAKEAVEAFRQEMDDGLAAKPGCSLKMIPTHVSLDHIIFEDKKVIVMDAGGTNLRVALVNFDSKGNAGIEYQKTYPMLGTNGEISKEEFFDQLTEYIRPVADQSQRIGFCFSFPTEILPNRDGKLIHFDKEVKVTGMEGEKIGENLLRVLNEKHLGPIESCVLINDTVATLLGGKAKGTSKEFDSYIGFILGTGTNTCYIEENANIRKNTRIAAVPGTQIVNIESGGYGKAPRSDLDDIFDAGTGSPHTQLFEKMISGAYQGGLLLTILKRAADEALFTPATERNIKNIKELTGEEIDKFCKNPYSSNVISESIADEEDRTRVYLITDAFYERVACLTAVDLAATILKSGKGKNPCRPVCISAEGTTFYKSVFFRPKLDRYVSELLNRRLGIYCDFIKTENANIIGTAVAGMLG